MKRINIAIDGYSSCGKGTLAKFVAQQLGYVFIDSGAMYRGLTLKLIENKIDIILIMSNKSTVNLRSYIKNEKN